ncbi:MAG: hypothetical protein HOQ05_11000 [Corynebacteriales bacterium]|nr:hypothetical protein [Mycobacteriales bacterium]
MNVRLKRHQTDNSTGIAARTAMYLPTILLGGVLGIGATLGTIAPAHATAEVATFTGAANTANSVCEVVDVSNGTDPGVRSQCPPQTWQHQHRPGVRCMNALGFTHVDYGPWVGGTSTSDVYCKNSSVKDKWLEEGPQ